MKTPSFSNTHRFLKFSLSALLTLGLGMGSAQALLTNEQAQNAAAAIMQAAPADQYNKAHDVAKALTQNTDPTEAAANAVKIVNALPANTQSDLAAGVGLGITDNFPGREAEIFETLYLSIGKVRSNPLAFVQQMANSASLEGLQQMASLLSANIRNQHLSPMKSAQITNILLSAISNKSASPQARASALAAAAADLSMSVIGKVKGTSLTPTQTRQLKEIASTLGEFIKPIVASTTSAADAQLVYNSLLDYAQSLRNSLERTVSSNTLTNIMTNSENTLKQQLPDSTDQVAAAFNDVQNNTTQTGNVTKPETQHMN